MANEKRLIDVNEAFEMITDFAGQAETRSAYAAFWKAGKAIQQMPTVDAVEVVHGRWERCGGDLHSSGYAIFCSVCNKTHFVHRRYSLGGLTDNELFEKPKYCPSCGAVMEVEE